MSTLATDNLMTLPQLAAKVDEPHHRVAYSVRSRSISPAAKLAGIRFFDQSAIASVRDAIAEMDARRVG